MAGRARTELSNRERMFVREYLVDMNASQAGIRAGYSPNSIGGNIARVMRRPPVKAAIAAAMAARERDLQIDAAEVLREIARWASRTCWTMSRRGRTARPMSICRG